MVKVQQVVFKNPSVNTKISPSPIPEPSNPEPSNPEPSNPEPPIHCGRGVVVASRDIRAARRWRCYRIFPQKRISFAVDGI